mmetsp:Transcript_41979/g.64280  ORF Transcript_41979/g.64280 Transcript_41979/m.64280 type:complete len:87 (-) Transcript_41979:1281-1541(-)
MSKKMKDVSYAHTNITKDFKKQMKSQRNYQMFQDNELAFIKWYVSIFGDNWRLIQSVLSYHPFTRGYLRSKDQISQQYINFTNMSN